MIKSQVHAQFAMFLGWSLILLIPIEAFRHRRAGEPRDVERINPNKHTIEDTYIYQNEINWTVHTSSDTDYEWVDLTSRTMRREYQVCPDPWTDASPDTEQWLRTKYLHVPSDRYPDVEVSVEIEYTFLSCEHITAWSGGCQNTFSVYKWESNADVANDNFPKWENSKDNYTKLKTIAAQKIMTSDAESGVVDDEVISTEVIRFTPSDSGFYISFKTAGTCMSLRRVQIYYYTCPRVPHGMAEFPAGASLSSATKEVEGRCIEHARLIDSGKKPTATCTQRGKWVFGNDQCRCYDGYEEKVVNSVASCSPCAPGTYRTGTMDYCVSCPANRKSSEGSAVCRCDTGYRHVDSSNPTEPCFKPAQKSKPVKLETHPTYLQFGLREPSTKAEQTGLRYVVTVCTTTAIVEEAVECIWKDKEIRYGRRDVIKVANLTPLTRYKVTVKTLNVVSKPTDGNTLFFTVTTPQKLPDKVLGLRAVTEPQARGRVQLKWEAPPASAVMKYHVKYHVKEAVGEWTQLNVSATNVTISDISAGREYTFMVAALNEAGSSLYQETKLSVPMDDEFPITVLLVAAASGVLIVISVIVCAYCCCCRAVPRKKIPPPGTARNTEMVGLVDSLSYPVLSPQSNGPRPLNDYEVGPDTLMPNFDCMEIDPIHISMDAAILGEGEFAEVRKATITNKLGERIPVAAKKLKTGVGMRAQLDFLEEGQILQGFDHPSIVSLAGVVTKHRPMMILTEFMEHGSLDEYLKQAQGKITVLEMVEMLRDVASGMAYLAERGFIHRDLAARNILVDHSRQAKISDFGLSRLMEANENNAIYMAHGGKIAIKWTAPEAIQHKKFTNASDVWSFGILCWEVMTYGERPFWEMANDEVIESISKGLRLPCPYGCPIVLHHLMVDCWNHKPENRPTFKQIESILQSYLTNPAQLDSLPKSMEPTLPHSNNRCSTLYTTLQ